MQRVSVVCRTKSKTKEDETMWSRTGVVGVIVGLLLSASLVAHAGPNTITYQGSVVNGDGTPVANGPYQMRFRIFDVPSAGTQKWEEIEAGVQVRSGLFSVTLGDGPSPFATLFATNNNLWLEVAIDLNGVGGFEPSEVYGPRQKLAGAAWAFDFAWVKVAGTTQQAAPNRGYVANNAALVAITLPISASLTVGDTIRVSGGGAGGWKIAQNAGQKIRAQNLEIPNYSGTWTPRESNRAWNSVASSADGTKLVACTGAGALDKIYTSSDSGGTWTARGSNQNWYGVASSADGTKLVACVYGGQLYTSSDSGVTWTARQFSRLWRSVASSADGSKLVACVQDGQIYTSSDSGATWTAREYNRGWSGVASSADGAKLVACAITGRIYTSSDSGVTWTARESNRGWSGVASSADGTRLVACDNNAGNPPAGQIHTSSDSGVTWTPRESNRYWATAASSADGTKLLACANGGQIYTSSDSGVTWNAHESDRTWVGVASSADGTKLVAGVGAPVGGRIYTFATNSCTVGETTVGTGGCLTGNLGDAVELQYIGANTFVPLSHEGSFGGQ
jgi:hypothetical protein